MAAGKLTLLSDEKDEDSERNLPASQVLKTYLKEEASLVLHFFKPELNDIASVATVQKKPATGKVHSIAISVVPNKKELVKAKVRDLNSRLGNLYRQELPLLDNKSAELSEFLGKQENENGKVTYLPDIANGKVTVWAKSKHELVSGASKVQEVLGLDNTSIPRKHTSSRSDMEPMEVSYPDNVDTGDGTFSHRKESFDGSRTCNEWPSRSQSVEEEHVYEDISSDRSSSFEFCFFEKLALLVYKASILRLEVDVIVNAANERLAHAGGVAYVISKAAGYKLEHESKKYVEKFGPLNVTENTVTTAGDLKHYKGVIHAVGPVWYQYSDKVQCMDDLYDCIFNILLKCDEKRFESVAIPAISSGIFAVPKELCAEMYVKAVANFAKAMPVNKYRYPREVHFVDINTNMLDRIKDSVAKWQKDPSSVDQRRTVPKYLEIHGSSATTCYRTGKGGSSAGRHGGRGRALSDSHPRSQPTQEFGLSCMMEKLAGGTFVWGGIYNSYVMDKKLTVKIFTGEIHKAYNVDAVVCSVKEAQGGYESTGFIAATLKDNGGRKYQKHLKEMLLDMAGKLDKSEPIVISKCKGGSLAVRFVIHVVLKPVLDAVEEELSVYKETICYVLKKADEWGFRCIVLPLIGTGNIQSNRDRLLRCCIAVLKGIDAFCQNKDGGSLREVHLVNNNNEVTALLKQVFDTAARAQGTGGQNKQCIIISSSKGKGRATQKYEKTYADAVGYRKQEDTSVQMTKTPGKRSNFDPMPLPSHPCSDQDDDDIYDQPCQTQSQIESEKEDRYRSSEMMSQTKKNEKPSATETKKTEKQSAGNLMIISD